MEKNKIIIDTDPGVDDALAIMYLLKYWCKVSWISTVYWNSNINDTTKNALKILSILGDNTPVYRWESVPLKKKSIYAKSHWDWWFWWYDIELTNKEEKESAIDFLVNLLEKEKNITIILLWPLTNIAKLSIIRPDLLKNIWKLIILWWVLWEKWNITDEAEFNIYNDPDALEMVLAFNIDKYIIPINVCRQVYFTMNDFSKIKNSNFSKKIKSITSQYIDYYTNNKGYWDYKWWVMYDLLATVFFTNPELFDFKKRYLAVDTNWKEEWKIYEVSKWETNCILIVSVEADKLKTLFFKIINNE